MPEVISLENAKEALNRALQMYFDKNPDTFTVTINSGKRIRQAS